MIRLRAFQIPAPIALIVLAFAATACASPAPIVVVATVTPAPPTEVPTSTPTPSPTPIPYKDTIVVGVQQEPRTLHPFLADSPAAIHILDALYERYVTSIDFAYQANPSGGLLADIPTLENGGARLDDAGTLQDPGDDQLTLIFKMLPGPQWCDGQAVTAHDSVYAFDLANDPDSGVSSRAALDKVESYRALDDETVEVKLKPGQPDPSYSAYFWTPLPEHLWGKRTALALQTAPEAARRPCGYGPYTVAGAEVQGAGWAAGDQLTLAANPHYFRGAPRASKLIFKFIARQDDLVKAVLDGHVDIVIGDDTLALRLPELATSESDGTLRLVTVRSSVWEQLVFNLDAPTTFDSTSRAKPHPILSDVRVRQAIAYAIDRKALVDRVYAGRTGVMNETLFYANHPLYAPEAGISVYAHDPDRAAALLSQAGWRDADGDGIRECEGCTSGAADGDRLALTYHTTSSALRDQVVEQIKNDLRVAGFEISVDLLPSEIFFGDITGLIVGDFELGQLAAVTGADPDGERLYGCDWIPSPENGWYGENYSGWCNQKANEALYVAGRSLRVDARRAAYADFQREYTREVPGLPLFARIDVFVVNPRLENLKPNDSMPSATWNAFELGVRNP